MKTAGRSLSPKIRVLARKQCANYVDDCGRCIYSFDGDCWAGQSDRHEEIIYLCSWFLDAVLPTDQELEHFVNRQLFNRDLDADLKTCGRCKRGFVPTSNRQKYCQDCRSSAENKRKAKWARENRVL